MENKDDKKYLIIIIILFIIIIGSIILFFSLKSKTGNEEPVDIYERAYSNLGFKEDQSLTKVYCYMDASNGDEVNNKKTIIYYFRNNELVTHIIHNEVSLSDTYMDYYDEMYEAHKKSLEKDYNYKNVRVNIEKDKNEILDTIIVTKASGEKMLEMPNINGKEEAKMIANSRGYSCK